MEISMHVFEVLERIFGIIVNYGVLVLEFIGVCIILYTAVKCLFMLRKKDRRVRLILAVGIATALEFKLGGEVLRTAIVRDLSELAIVGAIVALRCVMTFLIHWEINEEERKLNGTEE